MTTLADGISLIERPLCESEARQISLAIRDTHNILGYRPAELLRFPLCIVAERTDGEGARTMAGACVSKRIAPGWSEIAALCVFPDFRRQGIGAALFAEACRALRLSGDRILCISREESVLRWMDAEGMHTVPEWRLPVTVHLAKAVYYFDAYRFREGMRKSVTREPGRSFVYAVWRP